jgi:hypothetical protein
MLVIGRLHPLLVMQLIAILSTEVALALMYYAGGPPSSLLEKGSAPGLTLQSIACSAKTAAHPSNLTLPGDMASCSQLNKGYTACKAAWSVAGPLDRVFMTMLPSKRCLCSLALNQGKPATPRLTHASRGFQSDLIA